MALLADTRTSPIGGWRYVQPETSLELVSGSLVELSEKIQAHRKWKGLTPIDIPSIQLDVQRQICSGLSTNECRPESGEDYRPTTDLTRDLTSDKAIAFSRTAFEAVAIGKFVDKSESERRAAICRSCQFNKASGGCACGAFYKLVDALVPASRTEPGLKVCAACGCTLKAKVLLPIEAVFAGNEGRNINFPAHCWQDP